MSSGDREWFLDQPIVLQSGVHSASMARKRHKPPKISSTDSSQNSKDDGFLCNNATEKWILTQRNPQVARRSFPQIDRVSLDFDDNIKVREGVKLLL